MNLKKDQIFRLGLVLGLRAVPTLDVMKDSPTFLYDRLTAWLQGQDNVGRRGGILLFTYSIGTPSDDTASQPTPKKMKLSSPAMKDTFGILGKICIRMK